MSDILSHTLQENLLTLLCFDDDNAPVIRQSVNPEMFSPEYRAVIKEIYRYLDNYHTTPSMHTDELFEAAWENKDDEEKSRMYELLEGLRALKDSINPDWAMGRLESFTRVQSLRMGILDAAELIQNPNPTEDDIAAAYDIIKEASRGPNITLDVGDRLSRATASLFDSSGDENVVQTGIPALDYFQQGPALSRLHLFLAATGFGKSWWLNHVAKKAAMQRWNVLYLTMELSKEEVQQRLLRGFFSIAKRDDPFNIYRMLQDDHGRLMDFEWEQVLPNTNLTEKGFKKKLQRKVEKANRVLDRIHVKKFPPRVMTTSKLDAFLDMLEAQEGFVPKIICLDYPELMVVRSEYERQDIGNIYSNLKRIADERNLAVSAVSQINREGAGAKVARATHAAQDWSKIHHSDIAITASQTEKEKTMNLARLFVDKGRNDRDKYTVLISQAYDIGQFCLDSVMMNQHTTKLLKEITRLSDADVDDEGEYDN